MFLFHPPRYRPSFTSSSMVFPQFLQWHEECSVAIRRTSTMAHLAGRISACWIVALALMAGLLGACTTETGVVTTASVPATQTVTYQGGQYRLYGSGTAASPFYWVWV